MIVDEGAVAEDEKLTKALESTGRYRPIKMKEVEGLLEMYRNPNLQDDLKKEGVQVICGLQLPAAMRAKGRKVPTWMARPMFRQLQLLDRDEVSAAGQEHTTEFKTLFETVSSLEAAGAAVIKVLVKKLSTSLTISMTDIDIAKPMHFYGVDSLVALELRSWFAKELAADVAVFDLLGNVSCEAIGILAARSSAYKQDAW